MPLQDFVAHNGDINSPGHEVERVIPSLRLTVDEISQSAPFCACPILEAFSLLNLAKLGKDVRE